MLAPSTPPRQYWGPITQPGREQFIAFLVEGQLLNANRRVCIIAPAENQLNLGRNLDQYFDIATDHAVQTLEHPEQVDCFEAILSPSDDATRLHMTVSAYTGEETDPPAIALHLLRSLRITTSVESEGRRFLITQHEMTADGIGTYTVQLEGSPDSFRITSQSIEDVTANLGVLWAEVEQRDASLYFWESAQSLEASFQNELTPGALRPAFRSYYHAFVLARALPDFQQGLLDMGLVLGSQLRQSADSDHAAWVAEQVALLATELDQTSIAAQAYQLAGLAHSDLGWVDESVQFYELAKRYAALQSDFPIEDLAHLYTHYGLSLVSLLSHVDFDSDPAPGELRRQAELVQKATECLDAARALVTPSTFPNKDHWLSAIDLDRARLLELSGRPDASIDLLDGLKPYPDDKLRATRICYRLSALRRISTLDSRRLAAYHAALNQSLQELSTLAIRSAERLLWCLVAQGEALLAAGQPGKAARALMQALTVREALSQRLLIRTPGARVRVGGWPAIDVDGRLQSAFAQTPSSPTEEPPAWSAFVLADLTKSRFFNRDLGIASGVHISLAPYLATKDESYRKQVARGREDTRIVLAEYQWFLEHDAGEAGQQLRRSALAANQTITPEEVSHLLLSQPGPTALLSLWSTRDRTFLYLFDKPDRPPNMIGLDIDLTSLRKLSNRLYTGIHGNAMFPQIDAAQPGKHEAFFREFLALADVLQPVVDRLAPFQHILLSPHGLWHSLPWHVLLMPLFWKRKLCPGISYIPSLRTALLLRDRMRNRVGYRAAGITCVAASPAEDPLFRNVSDTFGQLFKEAALPVQKAFGQEGTPRKVLSIAQQIGLHHILAHGHFEAEKDAMASGLLLSDGKSLPSKELLGIGCQGAGEILTAARFMAAGTSARHVTLQACSVGRTHAGAGDELWGLTRGLLAAGADSVIAPLWDVDLRSSTELLRLFYKRWLLGNEPKDRALAAAQRELAESATDPALHHFYHWGAFQLVGC